jgi:hypothetical protein
VTETDVSATIRIEGAKRGLVLMRNNSGAFKDASGRWIRFGLGNDSKRVNELMKSSDLIGTMSGVYWGFPNIFGIIACVESKKPGWRYVGTERELAQLAFINLMRRHGGFACFATSWSDVENEITCFFQARANTQRSSEICAHARISCRDM